MLPRTLAIALAVLTPAGLASSFSEAGTLYASATGTATSGCSASAPCQSIGSAVVAANPGDTIVCLSQPPYGPTINITKSITIDCLAAGATLRDYSAVIGGSTVSVVVNIPPSSSDPLRTVRLRGLSIDGAANPNNYSSGRGIDRGIDIQFAAAVYVEDCVIANVNQQGIYDHRTGGQTKLYVNDTVISGNGGPGIVTLSAATAITVLDNVKLLNNTYGLAAGTGNNVAVSRSVISGNTTAGVEADSGAQVNVSNSVISHNNVGVQYGGGTLRLLENVIQFNNTAVQGAAVSMGANRFSGNGTLGTTPGSASGAPADVYN